MHDLTTDERRRIAEHVSDCPMCHHPESVIYRSSAASVTMRCKRCGLQWTCTYKKIEQAAVWLTEERAYRYAPTPERKSEPQRRKWEDHWPEPADVYEIFTGKEHPNRAQRRRDAESRQRQREPIMEDQDADR